MYPFQDLQTDFGNKTLHQSAHLEIQGGYLVGDMNELASGVTGMGLGVSGMVLEL